jgi:hypothetical protein
VLVPLGFEFRGLVDELEHGARPRTSCVSNRTPSDPVGPAPEALAIPKARQAAVHPHEDVLKDVVDVAW